MMKSLYFVLLIILAIGTASLAGQSNTGLTFLSLGVGGRSLAMGEAYVAASDDAAAMHFNPATLSLLSNTTLSVMHREWIQGTNAEYIAGAASLDRFSLGLSLYYVSIPDIEIRTVPGPPAGTFSARNAAIGLSGSYNITDRLMAGATMKYVYQKILIDATGGFAFDIGGLYSVSSDLAIGLSLLNLGSMSTLRYEAPTLPRLFRGGLSYTRTLENFPAVVTASADIISPLEEGDTHMHFGGEVRLYETIAVRGGYQTGYDARGLTLGTGFASGIVKVDYAFIPTQYDLGSTHAISLSLTLR